MAPREGGDVARILVTDDDRVIQQLVQVNLELEGYEVDTAGDGEEALVKVGSFKPELIVLDIMMPRMDGREVCRRVKADPATRDIHIVFLSARAQEVDVQSGLDLGADAYVTKPFDPAELIDVVRKLLAGERVS
jgi:DNA-binding response OmpR family regulator